jgi:hypothetical protein
MKKQFEILDTLHKLSKDTNDRINELKKAVDVELENLRTNLLKAYDYSQPIMYLVEFKDHQINFYKVHKTHVTCVSLFWLGMNDESGKYVLSPITVRKPQTLEEAEKLLKTYNSPTFIDVRGKYAEFGYFHDVMRNYHREDFIAEKIYNKEFLYEITSDDFSKAISSVYNVYNK